MKVYVVIDDAGEVIGVAVNALAVPDVIKRFWRLTQDTVDVDVVIQGDEKAIAYVNDDPDGWNYEYWEETVIGGNDDTRTET